MAMNLTADQVLEMAPDAASAKSGKELASGRKWSNLGTDERAAWGECQGSGANPYQTRVDFTDYACKCSCPSRKFPCKHGLGLLLMLVQAPQDFRANQAPSWVTEWLDGRNARSEKKAAKKADEAAKPVDTVAQAKRADQRKQKVAGGVGELDRWMQDLVRQGLASVQEKPYTFWESMAARLVDAQAPGLARLVRECSGIPSTGEGWQDRLLERLGRLYLLVEAWSRIDSLSPELQEELRSTIGFTISQEEVLAKPSSADTWDVVGQRVDTEDKLRVQRTWLYGRGTGQWALVLAFAHGTMPLDTSLVSGTSFTGELAFFPASVPLRALIKSRADEAKPLVEFSTVSINVALENYGDALAKNPWLERYPMSLANVTPVMHDRSWTLVDDSNRAVQMSAQSLGGWQLAALSVGEPVSVFGEWDGQSLTPLAVTARSLYTRL